MPSNRPNFVAIGGVAIEVAGEGDAAAVEVREAVLVEHREVDRLPRERIDGAVVVGIQQPAEAVAHHRIGAVHASLSKPCRRRPCPDRAVSKKLPANTLSCTPSCAAADQRGIDCIGESEIAVGEVEVLRIVHTDCR